MKNREKFAKEIFDVASDCIAVTKEGECVVKCTTISCSECLFVPLNCREKVKEWAESEYVEKPVVISRRDKAFLDCLREEYKFITRDNNGLLCAHTHIPIKSSTCWISDSCKNLRGFDIDFPMVKWKDEEPWKIEDLKKSEVVIITY